MTKPKYVMRISRLTVDKLGVKLYDKVSAVIAELVSNSYDADATSVTIEAPMGKYLASTAGGKLSDLGFQIVVTDNGCGMTPEEMQSYFLVVGSERRIDPKRGDVSKKFKRKVTGRKGVGKLAPFGICQIIEVISSGGDMITEYDGTKKLVKGYRTSHIILNYEDIKQETHSDYQPKAGTLDQTIAPHSGTKIILRNFAKRQVPELDLLERQISQRFGIPTKDWSVVLTDNSKAPGTPGAQRKVGSFNVETMANTKIEFRGPLDTSKGGKKGDFEVIGPDGKPLAGFTSGFDHDGSFYPVRGWVAYSKAPYKDELMSGVRIYCRGKIAAQTVVFGRAAGFHGEHQIRSYLTGELHADWLDQEEDLIQTDRRDILWSDDVAAAFQTWGQGVVSQIGKLARNPMKTSVFERFVATGKIYERIAKAFPGADQKGIRDQAEAIAKKLGGTLSPSEVDDPDIVNEFVELTLLLAPHITLDEMLRAAADESSTPAAAVSGILRTARLAELASFGRIADDRIRVIERLIEVKDNAASDEAELQRLIEAAPWLINPQWAPITANQSFKTFKEEFKKFFKKATGQELNMGDFSNPSKRPDFVLSNQDSRLEIIEIKKPDHEINNDEMKRIVTYHDTLKAFLEDPGNDEFRKVYPEFRITLVADGIKLTGSDKMAFDALTKEKILVRMSWSAFLKNTKKMHEAFLTEAERQKKLAMTGVK